MLLIKDSDKTSENYSCEIVSIGLTGFVVFVFFFKFGVNKVKISHWTFDTKIIQLTS